MSFRSWLMEQEEFWFIASEVKADPEFPASFDSFRDLREYVTGGCFRWGASDGDEVVEAFRRAWLLYYEEHEQVAPATAWCTYCDEEIEFGESGALVVFTEYSVFVVHRRCRSSIEDSLAEFPVLRVYCEGLRPLQEFGQPFKNGRQAVELFRLWGFRFQLGSAGFVYFVQQGDAGPVKIGYAKSVQRRLLTLQTAHSDSLKLLAAIKGSRHLEHQLHTKFASYRMGGEWFAPMDDLISFAKQLGEEIK